jgi:hypothetical protein
MHVCMCVYLCTWICLSGLHDRRSRDVHLCLCICLCMNMCVHECIRICLFPVYGILLYTCIISYQYIDTHIHIYTHTHTTYSLQDEGTCLRPWSKDEGTCLRPWSKLSHCTYMFDRFSYGIISYIFVHTHIHIHTQYAYYTHFQNEGSCFCPWSKLSHCSRRKEAPQYAYMYVCMYVCVRVFVCVCIYL